MSNDDEPAHVQNVSLPDILLPDLPVTGAGLAQGPAAGRIRARGGGQDVAVLRLWPDGFSVAREDAPRVAGRVDLYDGPRFLCRALVLAGEEREGERRFEFKYATAAGTAPPAPDHVRADAPADGKPEADAGPDAIWGAARPRLPQPG